MKEYKEQMEQIQHLQQKLEGKQHLNLYHSLVQKLNENSSESIETVEADQSIKKVFKDQIDALYNEKIDYLNHKGN